MTFNGNEIPVESGSGKIEFTATPASSYGEEGTARKTYEATAKLKDSVYRQEIEYFVAEPVIQVQSAALSQLYLNCGNELDVLVPALGSAYNPSFSVQGGSSIEGQERGRVTIIPNAPKVTLGVSSNGNKIGNKVFSVRKIPKPEIQVYNGSKPVNLKQGEKATAMRVLRVDAIPDENNSDPVTLLQDDDVKANLDNWLEQLSDKQREVVERRFGLHGYDVSTLEEVGNTIGVTRERVRQIQLEALKKLRDILEKEGFSVEALFK
jgi:gliding motility-associated protein GldM